MNFSVAADQTSARHCSFRYRPGLKHGAEKKVAAYQALRTSRLPKLARNPAAVDDQRMAGDE